MRNDVSQASLGGAASRVSIYSDVQRVLEGLYTMGDELLCRGEPAD